MTKAATAAKKRRSLARPPLFFSFQPTPMSDLVGGIFVADEAELGDARPLDDRQHLVDLLVARIRRGLEMQLGRGSEALGRIEKRRELLVGDRRAVPRHR